VSGVFTFAIDAQSRGYVLTGVADVNITDVTVPSEYMGLPVVSIGSGAFRRMKISSVIIPEGVKRISYGAFEECSLLETAELPSTLEVIEDYAFSKCVSLQTAELPSGLTDLGERAFYGCSSLVYVSLPENIAEIKAYTFADCVSLRTAELPSGCVDIKEYAFYGCRRLDSVTLPPSLDTIGAYAFACSGVENMDFPRTLERICERAFEKTFLREIEIQPFTVVESKAFAECLYLESVTYSSYITGHDASGKPVYPGSDTFYGCENLKYVKLDCIETAYAMFENCVSLERVNITRALAFLRPDTFRGCKLIEVIEYEGSESEWNNIAKPVDWAGYSADYNLIFGVE
jgi:hypothetical protein